MYGTRQIEEAFRRLSKKSQRMLVNRLVRHAYGKGLDLDEWSSGALHELSEVKRDWSGCGQNVPKPTEVIGVLWERDKAGRLRRVSPR